MTREEFIAGYISRGNVTREWFDKHYIALPCECEEACCEGWAAVHKDEASVLAHLRSYTWEKR